MLINPPRDGDPHNGYTAGWYITRAVRVPGWSIGIDVGELEADGVTTVLRRDESARSCRIRASGVPQALPRAREYLSYLFEFPDAYIFLRIPTIFFFRIFAACRISLLDSRLSNSWNFEFLRTSSSCFRIPTFSRFSDTRCFRVDFRICRILTALSRLRSTEEETSDLGVTRRNYN